MSSPNNKLSQCAACGGFVPASATTSCPHCFKATKSSTFSRLKLRALGGAFGGSAIAFTLMACYGAPPCEDPSCRADNNSDGGEDTSDGGTTRRDANRPDVIVTPKDDGGQSSDAGSDADPDAGDGG